METINVKTKSRDEFVDITDDIRRFAADSGVSDGVCTVYVPHTTAGVTINENADPSVVHDILKQLDDMIPWRTKFYKHSEGNSAAHIKSSLVGSSQV